jgi:putative serine protease PepD
MTTVASSANRVVISARGTAPDGPPTGRAGRRSRRAALAVCAVPLVLAGCTAGGSSASGSATAAASSPATGGSAASTVQAAYERVISDVLPSVVEITTTSALGSGIVYDDQGHIVTNAHVVGDATTFQVMFANSSTRYPATLVAEYKPDDLAVIQVHNGPALHPATFADSSKVDVGTMVLAMGNPLGLSSSVTDGIVSAVGRTVSEPQGGDSPGATLPQVIQTSAAINPGNSGGALVDLDGKVIGIPTLAAIEPQQTGGAAPGIGFAIASDVVTDIADQIIKNGRVMDSHRAAIGATVSTVADASGAPVGVGIVSVTPGGAAEAAGIQAGDVLVSLDGKQIGTAQQLATVLAGLEVGQQVSATVVRNGGQQTLDLTLGELPAGS